MKNAAAIKPIKRKTATIIVSNPMNTVKEKKKYINKSTKYIVIK